MNWFRRRSHPEPLTLAHVLQHPEDYQPDMTARSMVMYYIAGPMSGIPDYNRPAFARAVAYLQRIGFKCVSPVLPKELEGELSYATYIRLGVQKLDRCSHILLLPGWEASVGATLEILLGMRMGMTTMLQIMATDGRYTMRLIEPAELLSKMNKELLWNGLS